MEAKNKSISILMLPWLAHGHINPFLELAKKLTCRNFHIFMCSTSVNLNSIKKSVMDKYSESIELVELQLPFSPDLPPQYHTTNGLPPHLMDSLRNAFGMASPNFEAILQRLKPDLVIYDFGQPWAALSASSMNIPAVQFLTLSAAVVSMAIHMGGNETDDVNYPYPEIYLRDYELDPWKKALAGFSTDKFRFDEALKLSREIILMKTCRDFEGKYMDYLSKLVSNKKIVAVGSLVQDSSVNQDSIIQWLDKKEKGSAVFVSFGSEFFLTKEEIHAVAQGLELSKVNFIWVIRFPHGEKTSLRDVLPEGFLERVGEKGMILQGWAPQATILKHVSIGGFVSHCGWGSTMETMKFGVPIIAMPMHLDQPLNARLVEYIGIAMEVVRDEKGLKLPSEEIARVIRMVVLEESGEVVRKKAKEVSEMMNAKGDEEMDEVVEELVTLCNKK